MCVCLRVSRYLITGHTEKLKKMVKIAEMRNDVMGQFHNSLYLGDVSERVKVLHEVGQLPLAYITAKAHGLEEEAEELSALLQEQGLPVPAVKPATAMRPPVPLVREENWPLLQVTKSMFDGIHSDDLMAGAGAGAGDGMGGLAEMEGEEADDGAGAGGWGDDMDLQIPGANGTDFAAAPGDDELDAGLDMDDLDGEGGWEMDDLDLPEDVAGGAMAGGTFGGADEEGEAGAYSHLFRIPTSGVPASQKWAQKCDLVAEHAAAGSFDTAMRMLNRQLGVVDFAPLKQHFLDLAAAAHASFPTYGGFARLSVPIEADWEQEKTGSTGGSTPLGLYKVESLEQQLKVAYKLVTGGKFTDAIDIFTKIIHMAPFLIVQSSKEEDAVKELVTVASEYLNALLVEMERRQAAGNASRQAELAAYFTHFNLQPIHLSLTLRQAMSTMFKLKNFNTAATLCHRLLEVNPPLKIAQQARQVLAACEKQASDAVELNYDPRNPFVMCAASKEPIYRGTDHVTCPMCQSKYLPAHAGTKCLVCKVAKVGASVSGLSIANTKKKGRKTSYY